MAGPAKNRHGFTYGKTNFFGHVVIHSFPNSFILLYFYSFSSLFYLPPFSYLLSGAGETGSRVLSDQCIPVTPFHGSWITWVEREKTLRIHLYYCVCLCNVCLCRNHYYPCNGTSSAKLWKNMSKYCYCHFNTDQVHNISAGPCTVSHYFMLYILCVKLITTSHPRF